jgi:hypothetical protein
MEAREKVFRVHQAGLLLRDTYKERFLDTLSVIL